jgi:hypothetical protein
LKTYWNQITVENKKSQGVPKERQIFEAIQIKGIHQKYSIE